MHFTNKGLDPESLVGILYHNESQGLDRREIIPPLRSVNIRSPFHGRFSAAHTHSIVVTDIGLRCFNRQRMDESQKPTLRSWRPRSSMALATANVLKQLS